MYRPENWSRIKHTYFNKRGIDFTTEEKAEAFEAGADAILEALKDYTDDQPCGECGYFLHLTIPDIIE